MSHSDAKLEPPEGGYPDGSGWPQDDTVSLARVVRRLYRYRGIIAAVGIIFATLYLPVSLIGSSGKWGGGNVVRRFPDPKSGSPFACQYSRLQ